MTHDPNICARKENDMSGGSMDRIADKKPHEFGVTAEQMAKASADFFDKLPSVNGKKADSPQDSREKGVIVGLLFECPECGERIYMDYPDPFEMLSLHQSCMHWTCPECGKPIELTSADILEKAYGYTGASENRGGLWRDVRGFIDAVRKAVGEL